MAVLQCLKWPCEEGKTECYFNRDGKIVFVGTDEAGTTYLNDNQLSGTFKDVQESI